MATMELPKNYNKYFSRANSKHGDKKRSDSLNALEELLQCGICYDRLSDSRMLPCQHTFCLSCLQRYTSSMVARLMKNKNRSSTDEGASKLTVPLPCPSCQIVLNINDGDLTDLPTNIYINNLVNLVENKTTTLTDLSATIRCIKCQTICDNFTKKFCEHCKQIFCKICWTSHLSTLKSTLWTLLDQLKSSKENLKHHVEDFSIHCKNVATTINHTTEERIKNIKDKEERSLKQVNEIKQSEENIADILEDCINKTFTEIERLKFDIYEDDQKVKTFMNYHKITSKLLEDISRWADNKIMFDDKSFKIIQTNSIGTDNYEEISSGADNTFESVDTMSAYYRENNFKTKLVWNKCPRPGGVGIPPWATNLLYIATTDKKAVLIMDRNVSKVIGKLSTVEMICPQGITFCGQRQEVYVSDKWKHRIYVFNSEGDYLRTLASPGIGKGELKGPISIALNQEGNLIICDCGNDRVVVLNPDDGQQMSIFAETSAQTQFHSPTGVAIFEDKIIISDTGNHLVKVFSVQGKKLFEFGSVGVNRGQFRTAEVVACDPMGFIFVGDSGNARIQIFTPTGEYVKSIGGFGESSGKFSWISGIVVSPQLEIIATDYKNRCLQIFKNDL
ncbi:hypothetical protein FQA39_LY04642 [Lamprigera yunnana]|nr:hypothetical protein FQA39_LY04642 [Lamprigera yunnana]